jgi:hypothetical protein
MPSILSRPPIYQQPNRHQKLRHTKHNKTILRFRYSIPFSKHFCDRITEEEVDVETEDGASAETEECETGLGFVPVVLAAEDEGQAKK